MIFALLVMSSHALDNSSIDATKPTLHMIGLFHTITSLDYSHCAFTGKVLRFAKMMRMQGWKVIEYGNVKTESGANEFVALTNETEFYSLLPRQDETQFFGDRAMIGTAWHQRFDQRLVVELSRRLNPFDIVCHPFGHAHQHLKQQIKNVSFFEVESGIGYPTTFLNFRIFESYAKYHYILGSENGIGRHYNWVIPNYFELNDWFVQDPSQIRPDRPIVFMGRITQVKGMDTIREIAKVLTNRVFWIAGQGNFSEWFHGLPNVYYKGPLKGGERANFLRGASCMLMPTTYVEPFGGAGVESQLMGVPLLAVDSGAFTETIEHGKTGFRCHTLGDWIKGIERADQLDRLYIRERAQKLYGLETVGVQYDAAFKTIYDLRSTGWYTLDSHSIH